MEQVTLSKLTENDWTALIDGERQPWGADGEGLQWGEKDTYLALRRADGRLVAVAGAVVTTVGPQHGSDFQVVGLGSLFITRAQRGAGLMARLVEPLLGIARELGPDRAMLFCNPGLVGLYRRLGFNEITAPVWVAQPHAEVQMPLRAMWLALRAGAEWPAGAVHVRGLPF
jgi:GNAT superfamily N-acetyltransferase